MFIALEDIHQEIKTKKQKQTSIMCAYMRTTSSVFSALLHVGILHARQLTWLRDARLRVSQDDTKAWNQWVLFMLACLLLYLQLIFGNRLVNAPK